VGRVIDRLTMECQMDGGFIMGLGSALYEEIKFDDQGWVLNPNFTHYYVPRMKDVEGSIQKIALETPQKDGPFGARGIGEHVMIAVAPAIANAIFSALGVKINELPITAERLWRKVKEQKPELIERATQAFYGKKIQEVNQL